MGNTFYGFSTNALLWTVEPRQLLLIDIGFHVSLSISISIRFCIRSAYVLVAL
jgi:hypothetical protein